MSAPPAQEGGTSAARVLALLRGRADRTSRYLVMRDGVRVAIDVHVPTVARRGSRVPTIVRQTRYLRSIEWRRPLATFVDVWFVDVSRKTRQRFLDAGYAWVDVDARGSGASFGRRDHPWHADEIRDGAEIVDWIVQQPWSNGRVGSSGISYEGTTAEMLLVNGHPAVKAVAPQFSLFDAFTDVAFPGGIHQSAFTQSWARMNRGFDDNRPHEFVAMWLALVARGRMDKRQVPPAAAALAAEAIGRAGSSVVAGLLHGVRRTDTDGTYGEVEAAVRSHAANQDIHQAALQVVFRDDPVMPGSGGEAASIDALSPATHLEAIAASGAAVLGYGGWWDMGYQHGAIRRHRALGGGEHRLVIGPWDHSGARHVGPRQAPRPAGFDHDTELLRFFDRHLREGGLDREDPTPSVRYFTMGEEKWHSSDVWPPRGTTFERLYLGRGRQLVPSPPGELGESDVHGIDPDSTTGHLSRWKSGLGVPLDYSDRRRCDARLLTYDSTPLARDTEVTGHPIVILHLDADAADAHVFAYLEEVTPSGDVCYVTEGCLRALHRRRCDQGVATRGDLPERTYRRADAWPLVPGEAAELVFDLLPTSYVFRRGHRVRLAIAGADRDHAQPLAEGPTRLRLHRSRDHASCLVLPVAKRGV